MGDAAVGWHLAQAGVLADATLPGQSSYTLARVYAPKAVCAVVLQRSTATAPLQCAVYFSSVMAVLGGAGHANYSAANFSLDSMAHGRRQSALAALSVEWGFWSEVGMGAQGAAAKRQATMGWIGITSTLGKPGLTRLHTEPGTKSPHPQPTP